MLENTQKALTAFGKQIEKQAKANLTRYGKKDTNDLYDSIKVEGKISKSGRSIQFDIYMQDYGKYVDKGVKGVGGTKANGTKWKEKKVVNSPFKYTTKMPPTKALDGWVLRKGFVGRNDKGQMMSRSAVKFAVAQSIFHTGLETTNFFSKPLEDAFKKLPDELVQKFGLDVDSLLKIAFE